jgi:hypothetical protein
MAMGLLDIDFLCKSFLHPELAITHPYVVWYLLADDCFHDA